PNVARDFYDLVDANLYYWSYLNSDAGERNHPGRPDLFTIRGRFLGCVYCKVGERIAGLYCLTEKDGKAYVDSAWCAYKQRGQGIGSELLQRACDKLIEMGRTPIHFIVRSEAMGRLVQRLTYPPGTIRIEDYDPDPMLDDLEDFLFTADEQAPS